MYLNLACISFSHYLSISSKNLYILLVDTAFTQSEYFWLNTAIYRSNLASSITWVWLSPETSYRIVPLSYDNWGPQQLSNFDGDSIYLNTNDYKFYVGVGSQIYYNSNYQSAGVLCESFTNGLARNQINVVEVSQVPANTIAGLVLISDSLISLNSYNQAKISGF